MLFFLVKQEIEDGVAYRRLGEVYKIKLRAIVRGGPRCAVVDTNCDPDLIQFVVPGNDDAIRSGDIMTRIMSDAVVEGRFIHSRRAPMVEAAKERSPEDEARIAREQALAQAAAAEAAAAREARVAENIESSSAPAPAEAPAAEAPAAEEAEAPAAEAAAAEAAPAAEAAEAPAAEAPAADAAEEAPAAD